MGLSMTATHAIWLVAIVTAAGIGADHLMEVEPHLREAKERAHVLAGTALATQAPGATNCYDPVDDKAVFRARNLGTVAIDTRNVTFLVDGLFVDGWVVEVEGVTNAGDWRPGEQAYFNVSGRTTEHQRVTAQTPDGTMIFSTKITCPRLATIVVTPSSASMQIGDTQDFTATGYDQFGQVFDGRPYSWSSGAGTASTLTSSTGRLVAGTTAGAFTMVATSGTVTGSASITIHPGAPTSISVAPDPASVAAGGTQAFTATATDSYGNANTTAPITWSTNAGSITAGGILTAQTTAQTGRSVTATWTTVSDSAVVDVVAGAIDHITVTPSSATMLTSAAQAFTAVAYDQYNNVRSDTLTWAASRGSITQGGAYTAPTTTGAANVYANASGISGSASLTISANVNVLSMQTYNNGVATTSFLRGDTVEVRVTVRDQAGNLVPDALVNVEYTYPPSSTLACNCTGTTDGSGIASISYLLSGSAKKDTWTITTTLISGSDLVYVPGSNAQTSTTFIVS